MLNYIKIDKLMIFKFYQAINLLKGSDMMLNIGFCDDDSRFIDRIVPNVQNILKHLKVDANFYIFSNGNTLIKNFEKNSPYCDIIFLDIDMPEINGKEVARKLRILDKNFKLIFLTSYEEEALNTFQYNVIGFLPKAYIDKQLAETINRVIKTIKEDKLDIELFNISISQSRTSIMKIPLNNIMYFEIINKKIYLNTKKNVYSLHGYKFSDLLKYYNKKGFIDIHRTCIVNIQYIFSVNDADVCLDNGIILPLSRRKKENVLNSLAEIACEVIKC